ncbi:hypothetical protein [Halosimplex halophilum]|uniref:hypothetical protein n=1 Tax=Halosimplex halophilum TaxID=2559572 RepID=UPI00107FB896|nr:hypothetical protein [Halosimplex halophilum]
MPSRRVTAKLSLAGLLLSLALLVPTAVQRSRTLFMTDPYWRYQQSLWAWSIERSGRIWPFALERDSFLVSWVNVFDDNVASAVVVRFLADFGGLDVQFVQTLPLFGLVLVLSQALLASQLARRAAVFPVAVALAVAYQFYVPHLALSAHRGAMAWALLFALLAFVVTVNRDGRTDARLGVALLALGFIMGAHTLPVASLLLLSVVYATGRVLRTPLLTRGQYVTISGLIVVYYGVVFDWFLTVFSLFTGRLGGLFGAGGFTPGRPLAVLAGVAGIAAVVVGSDAVRRALAERSVPARSFALAVSGFVAVAIAAVVVVFTPADLIAAARTSGSVHPLVVEYQLTDLVARDWYEHLRWVARFTAVGLVAAAGLHRVVTFLRSDAVVTAAGDRIDALLVGVAVQGIATLVLLPVFAPSGGIDPQLLGLLVTPVFGGYVLSRLFDGTLPARPTPRHVLAVAAVVVLVAGPAFAVFTFAPTTPGMEIISTTGSDVDQARWAGEHLNERRVTSDFNTLSLYYTAGGRGNTYLPSGGAPLYSSRENASTLVDLYYRDPAGADPAPSAYLVRGQMEQVGMSHRASITTEPNPDLGAELTASETWNKVHSTGTDTTFVRR